MMDDPGRCFDVDLALCRVPCASISGIGTRAVSRRVRGRSRVGVETVCIILALWRAELIIGSTWTVSTVDRQLLWSWCTELRTVTTWLMLLIEPTRLVVILCAWTVLIRLLTKLVLLTTWTVLITLWRAELILVAKLVVVLLSRAVGLIRILLPIRWIVVINPTRRSCVVDTIRVRVRLSGTGLARRLAILIRATDVGRCTSDSRNRNSAIAAVTRST